MEPVRIAIVIAASLYIQAVNLANAGAWGVGTQSCAGFGELYASAQIPAKVEQMFIAWAQEVYVWRRSCDWSFSVGQGLKPAVGKQL